LSSGAYSGTSSQVPSLSARPFVSVLIDTYNHERFIEQAIESVLGQDFPDAEREIIVVDDGSNDRTPELVRKFEPCVRLLRKSNGGQASAFNAAIPECKGEIVAFLDGDDWWAPGKLRAVADALTSDSAVGLVGHGVTQVWPDGQHHTELIREGPRFRITIADGAKAFRLRKSFLGTSRMTFRKEILREIGHVPEALTFEADEYLFTLGGLLADVVILRESFTFYRVHEQNLFQITGGGDQARRRKQQILATLARLLREEFTRRGLATQVAQIILDSVQTEAELLELMVNQEFPWKTVRAELRNYRINHENAATPDWIFKTISLLPACILPSRTYYRLRRGVARNGLYRKARGKWLPFLQPAHVDRYRATRH
jgi:glycosyltransferase involved in cell wall biosynthesis